MTTSGDDGYISPGMRYRYAASMMFLIDLLSKIGVRSASPHSIQGFKNYLSLASKYGSRYRWQDEEEMLYDWEE